MLLAAVALATSLYPAMAPLAKYLMAPAEEIVLARSAAPDSVSHDAQVQVLTADGYKVAVKGTNGFVCVVERSWASPLSDPELWNPKIRSPICLNAAAARTELTEYFLRTQWALSGATQPQMVERLKAALAAHQVSAALPGAMCYMMSKHGYLSDAAGGAWHPHVMFFIPSTRPELWGADKPGSPFYSFYDVREPSTVFFVAVSTWSDGTPYVAHGHHHH